MGTTDSGPARAFHPDGRLRPVREAPGAVPDLWRPHGCAQAPAAPHRHLGAGRGVPGRLGGGDGHHPPELPTGLALRVEFDDPGGPAHLTASQVTTAGRITRA